ncbi:hypothetical protein BJX70DRAFT_392852 [Aspergillus crustosus]
MSTFLFYNPNSNPSRYSKKARFSKRQSILLGKKPSELNIEHDSKVNHGSASSICPVQSSIYNTHDLQPAGPTHLTATLESTQPQDQDNGTFSERVISDVGSLRSLSLESDPGADAGSLEVGGLILSTSRQNTQSSCFDDGLAPVNEDACITQPDSGLDGQESVRDSRQPSEGIMSGPDLTTYCLNLSPLPILRAHDFVIADDHATGHQSEVGLPLRAEGPKNFAESAPIWESDERCTSLNDDVTRLDAGEGTSNEQSIDRPASEFGPRPGISGPAGISGFGSPHYSNEHDSPVENAHRSIHDPNTCPHSVAGAQGYASARPTTPPEPIVESPIVFADLSSASDKSAPARSSPRTSSHQSRRKRFAEFSHVEIPSRPLAEASRPSVETAPLDRSDESCHPSLSNGPWRLDGTILSIDLRDAEQVPIFVGYSSFRVYNGNLTQSVTFFQGPVGGPPVNKSARAAGKPSPRIPARGPLSLEQKQRLVDLKQNGYTWDEIVTQFQGRKRSNLQAIYSRCVKDSRSLSSRHNDTTGHPFSIPRPSSERRSLAEIAGNARIKAGQTKQVKKSRYNLRARGSR